jgi:hypothetical protein
VRAAAAVNVSLFGGRGQIMFLGDSTFGEIILPPSVKLDSFLLPESLRVPLCCF